MQRNRRERRVGGGRRGREDEAVEEGEVEGVGEWGEWAEGGGKREEGRGKREEGRGRALREICIHISPVRVSLTDCT
jgi:hypothetical protein